MMSSDDCLRAALAALLRGDTAERDRYCDLARNVMNVRKRLDKGFPATDAIVTTAPICLPDRSAEAPN